MTFIKLPLSKIKKTLFSHDKLRVRENVEALIQLLLPYNKTINFVAKILPFLFISIFLRDMVLVLS